jgi:monoamine oxidase
MAAAESDFASPVHSQQFDVIVIGGGLSGLAASNRLIAAGMSVCLVEARERLGGRIATIHRSDCPAPLELGAEFIHQPAPTLLALLKTEAIQFGPSGERFLTMTPRGLAPSNSWELVGRVMDQAADADSGQSFEQFLAESALGLNQTEKTHVTAFVEGFNAAPANEISARAIGKEHAEGGEETYESFRVATGCDSIISALAKNLNSPNAAVIVSTAVKEIRWQQDQVEVTAVNTQSKEKISIRSSKLICTAPPPLLVDRSALSFDPEIEEIRTAAEQIGFGQAIRVLLLFKSKWWQESLDADGNPLGEISFITDHSLEVPVWWSSSPVDAPLLVGWLGGPKAAKNSEMSDGDLVELAIESLASIFKLRKEQLLSELTFSRVSNWQSDRYARGCYSFVKAGFPDAPHRLARPVENTLFFAGEAAHTGGLAGTMESALNSGYIAADKILSGQKVIAKK